MIFEIMIEEHVVQRFEVEAGSDEAALKLAKKQYKAGEIVLEPGKW